MSGSTESAADDQGWRSRLGRRLLAERLSSYWFAGAGYFAIVLFALIVLTLLYQSLPLLEQYSVVQVLTASNWDPAQNEFGFLPAIVGTIYVTVLSMAMGTPIALLAAIYVAEYADGRAKTVVSSFIDVLAAIPSVIFGLVALIVVVPFVGDYLAPAVGSSATGLGIFTVSLVMAIVVTPFMISLSVESLEALPDELRESSLGVGATKWETIRSVLLRAAGPGIFSAILLGFGRVFGATIVPAMLIGGQTQIPDSLFATGQTLPTLIVNDFGELMSLPLTQSALIFVGLLLVIVVWLFNFTAMVVRRHLQRRWQY
ncbi:phosphate ABC transporter permease subunit PstC [Natronobacterium gregoryi]|uniref:Phosphate transport system permease protein n=2 Tax=Natronobacterium gregoryi TaxID=44930 RepID=L0AFR7_NATGS|nr:phosphate ABC transporter permease subunit PstC [Natronobacterium gregoryi]AFZ71997.1 phosphate ABC transporter, permease protein PstC [Natronobacterium gregoryi SP2]ELY62640.1 phosphate ABC transporter permease [Natronobacterium gregoryi SP2]PLK20851.1 phosphate ABC transporter permease subunit PstC [Natronobacterium gregoryi SP2]SFJ19712.1 phosphate transport system permease protein [Natronobacterium gregoryi]